MTFSIDGMSLYETGLMESQKPVVLCGLPDIGLVGIIAVSHIIKEIGMEEVGYIDSDMFPPVVVFHHGEPKYPIRIFQKGNLIALFTETALSPESLSPLSKLIVKWAKDKGASLLVSIGGIGVPNRIDLESPKVYGAATSLQMRESIKNLGIPLMEEGFLVGPYALISKESKVESVPNLLLLAESFPQYPDPGAAANVILELKKFAPMDVGVKSLTERSEEIRMNARELMRKTAENMQKMGKSQEYELPMMYL
ncbi:MAG TPA: proteasome assembly chaperone family protein [Candidatus Methanomethylicus sp.]|nr:proteasome assembly chaperone family protein [Candidatus Methanomethylicus sp.]